MGSALSGSSREHRVYELGAEQWSMKHQQTMPCKGQINLQIEVDIDRMAQSSYG